MDNAQKKQKKKKKLEMIFVCFSFEIKHREYHSPVTTHVTVDCKSACPTNKIMNLSKGSDRKTKN